MALKGGALITRVATALVVVPLLLVLIWVDRLWAFFAVFIAVLAGVGVFEFYGLVRRRNIETETVGGIALGVLVALSGLTCSPGMTAGAFCGAGLLTCALFVFRGRLLVEGMAASVFGVFYVGWLPAHMLLLHGTPSGAGLVTLLVAVVALTDSAAYLVGSAFGRHKLAPTISPNKTWEGALAGLAAALAVAAIVYGLSVWTSDLFPGWGLGRYVGTCVLLSLVAQVGDLTESAMKRSAGIKDSGVLFPGHGGVLDRCDGYLFAAPVLYYLVTLFV